jgi:hypothetical protein
MVKIFQLETKKVDALLKGAEEFHILQSFSIFRIFPRLCSEKSFLEQVMTSNPLIKDKEAQHHKITRINREEMQSMKGLLVFNYIFLHLLFCILLQLDMV